MGTLAAQLKGSALCHQVSQATLEFYDGNKDHDEVKAWMAERLVLSTIYLYVGMVYTHCV